MQTKPIGLCPWLHKTNQKRLNRIQMCKYLSAIQLRILWRVVTKWHQDITVSQKNPVKYSFVPIWILCMWSEMILADISALTWFVHMTELKCFFCWTERNRLNLQQQTLYFCQQCQWAQQLCPLMWNCPVYAPEQPKKKVRWGTIHLKQT